MINPESSTLQTQVLHLSQQWLNANPTSGETLWRQALGEQTRQLLKTHPLPVNYEPPQRILLDQAIHQLHRTPDHWTAWCVLLLHRRHYLAPNHLSLPNWLQEAQQLAPPQPQSRLHMLAPPATFQVTLMVPTHNRLTLLKRTLAAILQQSHKDWHLVVCNDASTDETDQYCRDLAAKEPRMQYLHNEINLGLGKTFERMCNAAQTELVAACADDDWFYPDYLAENIKLFKYYPWVAAVSQGFHIVTPERQLLRKHGPYYPTSRIANTQLELQRCALLCPIGPGVIHRKSLLEEFAPLDNILPNLQQRYAAWDYLQTAKLLGHYEIAYGHGIQSSMSATPESLTNHRDNSQAMLSLLEHMLNDYNHLFGPQSYPVTLAEHYLQNIRNSLQWQYPPSQEKTKIMGAFEARAQQLRNQCSPQVPPHIALKNPYSCRFVLQEALERRLLRWGLMHLPPEPSGL